MILLYTDQTCLHENIVYGETQYVKIRDFTKIRVGVDI